MKRYFQKINKVLEKEIDPAYVDRAGIILSQLFEARVKNVLEIGCGRGFYLKALKEIRPKMEITGIDLNEEYLQRAKKYINNNEIKIIKGDVTKLKFKKNSFESVIASEVLEHIKRDDVVLKEVERVLKPGGIVMISVPNYNYPFWWDPINWFLERFFRIHIPARIWWLAGIWAGHVRLYEEEGLVKKVKDSGLVIEKVWRKTKYCLPFSHFLFYGIGKNIIERGGLKEFDRFSENIKIGWFLRLILKIVKWGDERNRQEFREGVATVGLVIKARKNYKI